MIDRDLDDTLITSVKLSKGTPFMSYKNGTIEISPGLTTTPGDYKVAVYYTDTNKYPKGSSEVLTIRILQIKVESDPVRESLPEK